jgi:ABC-type lipoprotein release transport system permease subunit
MDGLADHATLVAGAWPVEAGDPTAPIEVVLGAPVAQELGIEVGQELALVGRRANEPTAVPTRVVGIFSIDSVDDPYWNGDEQLLTGIRDNSQYRTFGPFLTTRDDLLALAGVPSIRLQWRIVPGFERLNVADAGPLRSHVDAMAGLLQTASGEDFRVVSGLPQILADAERSLLVSRTGVLLLVAQLSILAAYAIILTASLLVDHRRLDTAMLRSRGAGTAQIAALGLAEGLLLAIPAVLVAPWLAVAALELLNVAGPLAEVGLRISPRVTLEGYLAGAAAGLVSAVLLALPAVLSRRGFAAEQGGLSRQETRTFGQRMGIDVALLAVTGIALWQLRFYGAPLTRSIQGGLGLDPLLVAAPAIGLLAGGVVALRTLPLIAEAVEAAVSRGRGLVGTLSSRQLARRPLRYTRAALLLMLAMSMGVFSLSYAATWSGSQRDQAAYQAGADVRVSPSVSSSGLPSWALPAAYAGLPGTGDASPVQRIPDGITFAAAGSADLLALDAGTAAGIVLVREDGSGQPLREMLPALRDGRPEPILPALPEGAAWLRIVPRVDLGWLGEIIFDDETGEIEFRPIDRATVTGIRVSASAIVRDGRGLLHRISTAFVPLAAQLSFDLPLQPTTEGNASAIAQLGARLVGPVTLVGLGVDVSLPGELSATDAIIGVAELTAASEAGGPWTPVPLAAEGTWASRVAEGPGPLTEMPTNESAGIAVEFNQDSAISHIFGGVAGASARITFAPAAVAAAVDVVPVIVNQAFLEGTAAAAGDVVPGTLDRVVRQLLISAVIDTFPTTDPTRPLVIVDQATLGLLRLAATSDTRGPSEWWISTDTDGDAEALAGVLRSAPFLSAEVVTAVGRARSLSTDPVALAIIGALALGFVTTGLFAVVGLTASAAVSARQRRTEFALLRALGLSGRQLSGSLWLENGSLVFVSLLAGTVLGLLIGWLALPFVTVTQQAAAPIPSVLVHVPWDRIVLLDVVSALALGAAVLVLGAVLRRLGVGSVLRMGED